MSSTCWALPVGFVEASVLVLLPGFLFVRCYIPPFRISGKMAGWIWAHLAHFCLVPHDSAQCRHLPIVCKLNLFSSHLELRKNKTLLGVVQV